MSDDFSSVLDSTKRANLGHLLLRSARLLNDQGLELARQRLAMPELRPTHLSIVPHLDLEGTRQTELARRMDVTKQAVGPIVDDLERLGIVERVPDPTDGRARVVRFTESGRAMILDGLAVLSALESSLTEAIGTERMSRLKDDLTVLLGELEAQAATS